MKNLENFLLGSLYSPVEFGKERVMERTKTMLITVLLCSSWIILQMMYYLVTMMKQTCQRGVMKKWKLVEMGKSITGIWEQGLA